VREVLLALLRKEPAHGYELKHAIESLFGEVWPAVNVGQVYSTLGRLERAGMVRSVAVVQSSRPDKKVFELTPAGRDELQQWIDDVVPGDRLRDQFFSKLVVATRVRLADPLVLIDRQRRAYLRRLRALNDVAETAEGFAATMAVEGAVLHLQANLRWLERCEEALHAVAEGSAESPGEGADDRAGEGA
jgi:DNA-binding PadR family transcriptional regulator